MNPLYFITHRPTFFNFNLQNEFTSYNSVLHKEIQILRNNCYSTHLNQYQFDFEDIFRNESVNHFMLTQIINSAQNQLYIQNQHLMNQYLQSNILLLTQKLQNLEGALTQRGYQNVQENKIQKKKIKKLNVNCGHNELQHYANNMCKNCYHRVGRIKKPWLCDHKIMYAKGLCQNCYSSKYQLTKRQKTLKNSEGNKKIQQNQIQNTQAKMFNSSS